MRTQITRRTFLERSLVPMVVSGTVPLAAGASASTTGSRKTIIDSHVHLKHGDAARTEYRAETIVHIMDEVGIDKSIVFAMSTTTQRSIEMARAAVAEYPDRLIPYLYALPHYERPVIKEMEAAFADRTFRGIKIHAGECTLAPYVIDPVLKLAGQIGVPCLIDAAGNRTAAERLAKSFPDTAMIFAHMGRYLSRDERLVDGFIRLAGDHANVWLDLSGVALVEKIQQAVERIGANKLVWGSDGPHNDPDLLGYTRRELDKVVRLEIGEEEKGAILGGNVLRLVAPER